MGSSKLLINAASYENRIALVENNTLIEFHLERPAEAGFIGNIYMGKVVRVLPGMQAAFVDIGLERTGFLFVDDIIDQQKEQNRKDLQVEGEPCGNDSCPLCSPLMSLPKTSSRPIEELLEEGQEIMVQVSKEPIGSKGARLTTNITLPCRNLVFMPLTDHIGISRRITDEDTRQSLKEIIESIRPDEVGFIIRTVAENADLCEIEADMDFLVLLWEEIKTKAKQVSAPALIHKELDMTLKSVRDLFGEGVQELITDSSEVYENLFQFVHAFAPHLKDKISLYTGKTPLFDAYSIEVDLNRILNKKVWLRSGGYIIIEQTEALTVIDVNTGRFVGDNDPAETIFKTNMEAVKEISYQLRLRNVGGIIIIDFIDMDSEEHREELYNAFQEAIKSDKSRINILKISEFGLVQMTRKRSCESISQIMCEPCPHCSGDGIVKSRRTVCYEIFRKISHNAADIKGGSVTIKVHPKVANMLLEEEAAHVEKLEKDTGKRLTIIPEQGLHNHKYHIIWNQ